jgi:hypothetical protein
VARNLTHCPVCGVALPHPEHEESQLYGMDVASCPVIPEGQMVVLSTAQSSEGADRAE